MSDSMLALLLARYDRDLAMLVLQPILDRGPTAEDVGTTHTVEAMAAIDPARAVAIVESLPDDPDLKHKPFQNPKNRARWRWLRSSPACRTSVGIMSPTSSIICGSSEKRTCFEPGRPRGAPSCSGGICEVISANSY